MANSFRSPSGSSAGRTQPTGIGLGNPALWLSKWRSVTAAAICRELRDPASHEVVEFGYAAEIEFFKMKGVVRVSAIVDAVRSGCVPICIADQCLRSLEACPSQLNCRACRCGRPHSCRGAGGRRTRRSDGCRLSSSHGGWKSPCGSASSGIASSRQSARLAGGDEGDDVEVVAVSGPAGSGTVGLGIISRHASWRMSGGSKSRACRAGLPGNREWCIRPSRNAPGAAVVGSKDWWTGASITAAWESVQGARRSWPRSKVSRTCGHDCRAWAWMQQAMTPRRAAAYESKAGSATARSRSIWR